MTTGAATRGTEELEGTVFDGRFRLEGRVAEGGFAVVYKAWQVALDRRVALKILKARHKDAAGQAEFHERFAAEARTIAKLRHPHIVDVYDFAVATLPSGEAAPWMALEWLEGVTLAHLLESRRRNGEGGLAPRAALALLRPVLEALAHAHDQAIVHRDVKPSNIMVTETEQGAAVRLLDFGIAKIMADGRLPVTGDTRTESAPAFSPAYAAPEQVAFSRTGPWTDVHALGLLLTEVITGEPPFGDRDPDEHLFERVMSANRPTPASKGYDAGAFEPILAKALHLSPRNRWRNAGELLAALESAEERSAGALDTFDATVVHPVAAAVQRPRTWRLVPLALAAVVVGSAIAVFAGRNADTASFSGAAAQRAQTAAPTGAPIAARAPLAVAPVASSLTTGREAAAAPASANPPPRRKRRAASAPEVVGDGRDLFDDTE